MKTIAAGARGAHQTSTNGAWSTCLACGAEIEAALSRLGSLRCHDCRDMTARLDPGYVRASRRSSSLLAFRLGRRHRTSH